MIDKYLGATWRRDGDTWPYLNCWGLVRMASRELFHKDLPSLSGDVYDKRATTREWSDKCEHLKPCEPQAGAVACVWRGKLMIHVGLVIAVDGRLAVMDIDEGRPATVAWLPDFERRYLRVTYHA